MWFILSQTVFKDLLETFVVCGITLEYNSYFVKGFFTFTCLLTALVDVAPQMTSQPVSSIFPCFPLPSGTCELQARPFPDVVFRPLFLSALSSSPFTVPCKMVLARPDERETCHYHFSLHLFMMIRRSLCGLFACWILARTSSLVTWTLYEKRSILR